MIPCIIHGLTMPINAAINEMLGTRIGELEIDQFCRVVEGILLGIKIYTILTRSSLNDKIVSEKGK